MSRSVHPIETESYRILRERIDTSSFPPLTRAVIERVIHATADLGYADDLICDEEALERGLAALRNDAAIVTDVRMVAAGITGRDTRCFLREAKSSDGVTRSAAAIRMAFDVVGGGAIWVVGCAPTALAEIVALAPAPALVIGLPVGFVGAVEAKDALRSTGMPSVSNTSEKGGSAVAAATLNALLYVLEDQR
ncbi:MAG: precorrin-8X methylmutase [Mycobacteriales bacterium]